MSTTTSNLGLFKYDTTNPTDLASAFNIKTALNNNWDIIDNAIQGGGLPDQTDKAGYLLTTDGSEASWGETGEIYPVIETYINETSWYRVYSDGWCEQGGYATTVASGASIYLLRSFSDANYTIHIIQNTGGGTPVYSSPANLGTSSFHVYTYGGGSANLWWMACGYLAVGE